MVVLPAPLGPMIEHLALADREADVVDGTNAAKIDAKVVGLEEGHRSRSDFI